MPRVAVSTRWRGWLSADWRLRAVAWRPHRARRHGRLALECPRSNRDGFQQTEPRCNPLRERERRRAVRAARQRRDNRHRNRLLALSRCRRDRRSRNVVGRPDLDARKVAKDLKVQYVLTGAVQREGDLIQVSAQVTDGETGASVWSNRWQGPAAGDLLALQADVADGVASTLGSRNFFAMKAIGAAKAKAPETRTAYDLFALGYADYLEGTADGFADSSAISTSRSRRTRGSPSPMFSEAGLHGSTPLLQALTKALRSRKPSATSARRSRSIRSTPRRMSSLRRNLRCSAISL